MLQHTPGPWAVWQTQLGETAIKAESRPSGKVGHVCTLPMLSMHTVSMDEYHANARLIAAAPELLEKCKKIAAWLHRLADAADKRCINNRFETLVQANMADAKNYRITAADIERVIAKATNQKEAQQ